MSIIFFIIGFNITLSFGLFGVAGRLVGWKRSLQRLTRNLQVAQQTVEQHLHAGPTPTLPMILQYQQLESQLAPRLKSSAQAFAGLQRAHRLWRVTIKKSRGF